jgi:hypothetical protein
VGELGRRFARPVERARWFEQETDADLDVLVAAFLAFDRSGSEAIPGPASVSPIKKGRNTATSLSEFLPEGDNNG